MSAERNNPIIRTQSGDHGGFAGQACELDGPKVYGRGSAVEDPNAGRASVIEHSSERHLDFRLSLLARKPNGDRRSKRRRRGLTIEHVAGLVGAGLSVGGIRQLPEMCRVAAAIASRGPAWASRTTVWPAETTCPGSPSV